MTLEREHDNVITESFGPEVRELLVPSRCALVVIDLQHAYCAPDGSTARLIGSDTKQIQEMIPRLEKFIEQARQKGVPIIWARMIEDPDLSAPNVQRKMRMTDTPSLSAPNTPNFEYYRLAPQEGDFEVVKKKYDAFTEESLEEYLKQKGVQSLVLTGAYADVCVASTMRGAQSLGYDLFIPRDLVGVPDNLTESGEAILKTADVVFGWTNSSNAIFDVWNAFPNQVMERSDE